MGEKIRIGLIGLGCRGAMLLEDVFLNHEDAVISAVCDVYEDRCEKAAKLIVEERSRIRLRITGRYMNVLILTRSFCAAPGNHISVWPSRRWKQENRSVVK